MIDYCLGINIKDTRRTKPYFCRLPNREIINYEPCTNSKSNGSIYCNKHQYMLKFTSEQFKTITSNKGKICDYCRLWHFENTKRCKKCVQYNYNEKLVKIVANKCTGLAQNGKRCTHGRVNNTPFCDNHKYLLGLIPLQLQQLRRCSGCKSYKWWANPKAKTCNNCKIIKALLRQKKRMLVKYCIGVVKKNGIRKSCKYERNENGYCGKHQRQLWKYEMEKDGTKKVCYNYIRGCNTLLDPSHKQICCKDCRYQGSIYDVRRNNKYDRKYYTYTLNARAAQRNFDLSFDECVKLFTGECYYCGDKPYFCERTHCERLNGIDRVDNDKGYILDNCVSSCKMCNMTKRALDKTIFINMCEHILINLGILKGERHDEIFEDHNAETYFDKLQNENAQKEVTITQDQFDFISNFPCYLCGKPNSDSHDNGIDRLDNNRGYVIDNCMACCGNCNWLKHTNKLDDLINMMIKITQKHKPIMNSQNINIRQYNIIPPITVPDYNTMMQK